MLTSVAAAAVSTVDGNKAPELFALVVISAVEIFSALLHPVWSLYAVLLGAVSFAIGSLMLLWNTYHVRSLDGACCRLPKVGDITAGFLLAIFLLLWWAAGAGIVTFDGPFTTTSNGYFAAWAGLACSVLLLGECAPSMSAEEIRKRSVLAASGASEKPANAGRRSLYALLVCSVAVIVSGAQSLNVMAGFVTTNGVAVELAPASDSNSTNETESSGAADDSGDDSGAPWESVLVVTLASVTLAFTLLLLIVGQRLTAKWSKFPLAATGLVGVLWAVEVAVGTFRSPFITTGNGYFASWVGLIAVALAIRPHLPETLIRRLSGLSAKLKTAEPTSPSGVAAVVGPSSGSPMPNAQVEALERRLERTRAERDAARNERDQARSERDADRALAGLPAAAPSRGGKTPPKSPGDHKFALQVSTPTRRRNSGTQGSGSALATPGTPAEGRLWPLVDAFGEARARMKTAEDECDRVKSELADLSETTEARAHVAEAERDAAKAAREMAERHVDRAEGALKNATSAKVEAETRLREAEASAAELGADLADALAELSEVEEGKAVGAIESERDAALAELDDLREQLVAAHALIEALEKEKDDEKEKQKARVNAGKAALASRQKHRASMQAKGRERAPSASAPSGIPASAPSPPSVPSPEGDEPFMEKTSPTRAPAARETSPEEEDLSARRERRAERRKQLQEKLDA